MKNQRLHSILLLCTGILAVMLVFQLSEVFRFRIDLTEEKRYTISEATKATLRQLDNDVFVEVFLAGELPPEFQRFQKSIGETLEEFGIYADIQYKFTDPSAAQSEQARNRFFQSLVQRGIQPTNLNYRRDGQSSQMLIFPGAVVSVGANEVPVNLLSGNRTAGKEEVINESIEGLEYEFISAIRQLTEPRRRIGLVTGHGEPDSTQLAGLAGRLTEKYDVFQVPLARRNDLLTGYDALIVTKPTRPFSEKEKYLLDQFVMRGGRLLLFMDALKVNMDSASGEGTIALPYETGLDDLLFKYGVRINRNYVCDLSSGTFPVVTGNFGEQPQIQQLPWPFFPVITRYADHPAVKGLDASLLRFASTIDTVKAAGIRKTPLLQTSERTKVLGPPVRVSFNDLQGPLQPEFFTDGIQNVGYLLEGSFQSVFKNRFLPAGVNKTNFRQDGQPSKIIVVADGDVVRNELDLETNRPLDVGVDPYAGINYANGELITRMVDYLTDEDGLMLVRAKEIKIRPLDKVKVKEEKAFWQWMNVGVPVLVILLLGAGKYYLRKRKFVD